MRSKTIANLICALAVAAITVSAGSASARKCCRCEYSAPGAHYYYGYPYTHSTGYRIDPYWSYTSTRVPSGYQGDGSYYGLGFSGWKGETHGSYWYW
jgi:hypothetical protein